MTPGHPTSWVVGAGGLLGSSVAAVLDTRGRLWSPEHGIRWGGADAVTDLSSAARSFAEAVGSGPGPWQIAWCAGTGVTGSASSDLDIEQATMEGFLRALPDAGLDLTQGALFLASSAGGLYAGSRGAPFDEHSKPVPLAPYGHAKLRLEELVTGAAEDLGLPVLVGRISNLYGGAQNLAKGQGLISHLCRSIIRREPISIFVPLDTVRDHLYAQDAGLLVVDALDRLRAAAAGGEGTTHTKILASHQAATIGFLIAELGRIAKHQPQVVFGSSASSHFQARDLRLTSVVWPELDRRAITPLPVGMGQVLAATREALARGALR